MSKNYLLPSEITPLLYSIEADLEKGQENYYENQKRFGIDGTFKIDGKPVYVKLEGELSTDGIIEGNWALEINGQPRSGKYYSFSLDLTRSEDETAFDALTDALGVYVNDADWKIVNPSNNGKVNIKLKFSGTKFDARINGAKLSVNNVDDINATVGYDTKVVVLAEIWPTFSFKEQRAQFNIVARKIDFDAQLEITPAPFVSAKKSAKK